MALVSLSPALASVLFGISGGVAGFLLALLFKRYIPGRLSVLISAAIAGLAAELISGALGELTGGGAVILTSRLIGLFTGGILFRYAFRGYFGTTHEWITPYLASSFASWTAFAMSLEVIGIISILASIIGGFSASILSRAVSRYLPSTLEQASAMTQVSGLSWFLGLISYSLGIVVLYSMSGKVFLTAFGIFAASSVALLLSVLLSLPYVRSEKVYVRLTARIGTTWRYMASFILLFLFTALLILVGYQKSFSAIILLIAVTIGLLSGLAVGLISRFLTKEKKGVPPQTFGAILLGISSGQGIGVIVSIALDTAIARLYTATILELVFLSGLAATIAAFVITAWRVRHLGNALAASVPDTAEAPQKTAERKADQTKPPE